MEKIFKGHCDQVNQDVVVKISYVTNSNLKYGTHYKKSFKECSCRDCHENCCEIFKNAQSVIRQ